MKQSKIKPNNHIFSICAVVLLTALVSCIIVPMVWAFISSFKTELDYSFNAVSFPSQSLGGWQFGNYSIAYQILYVPIDTADGGTRYVFASEMFLNSVIYTVGCTTISLISYILMSYISARFDSRFGRFIYGLVIVVMTLPIVGNLPAEIQMAKRLGVYDNILGIGIMKGGFFGMFFLVFYAAFKSIPRDYSEAASIDGAGQWTILLKIILPMISGAITSVALLTFIGYWNEYYTPMVYLPSRPTIAYGLYLFEWSYTKYNTTPIRLAASYIVALPLLIMAIIFRDKLMGELAIGGLKG